MGNYRKNKESNLKDTFDITLTHEGHWHPFSLSGALPIQLYLVLWFYYVLLYNSIKKIIWRKLTCPSEERITESHELQLDQLYMPIFRSTARLLYGLATMCSVKVGARSFGFAAKILQRAAAAIGIRGRATGKLVREIWQKALHCSK